MLSRGQHLVESFDANKQGDIAIPPTQATLLHSFYVPYMRRDPINPIQVESD